MAMPPQSNDHLIIVELAALIILFSTALHGRDTLLLIRIKTLWCVQQDTIIVISR
jgi:hypothetical protein